MQKSYKLEMNREIVGKLKMFFTVALFTILFLGILLKHFFISPAKNMTIVIYIYFMSLILFSLLFYLELKFSKLKHFLKISNKGMYTNFEKVDWSQIEKVKRGAFGKYKIIFFYGKSIIFTTFLITNVYNLAHLKYCFVELIPDKVKYKLELLIFFEDVKAIKPSSIEITDEGTKKHLKGLVLLFVLMFLVGGINAFLKDYFFSK